nr:DedA family protein [Candidatus Woesearchaeota archaeon]
MSLLKNLIDFVLHVDRYLGILIQNYGIGIYLILFIVVFLETGLVLTPFLPGDSLIFIAGTYAANKALNVFILFLIFTSAAILGDTLNYWMGSYFGEKVFSRSRFFKQEYLDKTKEFYRKHGGKTIIMARFIPIIRTFAPFVAGIGKMNYYKFLFYNVIGGLLWVLVFLFGGYYFGRIPLIKENLTIVTYIIVVLSILPLIWHLIKKKNYVRI